MAILDLPKTCCKNVGGESGPYSPCDAAATHWYKHGGEICSYCDEHNYRCGTEIVVPKDPRCAKCGEPARIGIYRARRMIRRQLNADGTPGPVLPPAVTSREPSGYECSGGHRWTRIQRKPAVEHGEGIATR